MMNRNVATLGSLIVLGLNVASAAACPFCESETGQQVKAGIFNDHFWRNLLLTLMPFLLLLAVVMGIFIDDFRFRTQTTPKADAAPPANGG